MLYNKYLLIKYEIYINVEICTLVKFIVYFYKYIFKKSNHVDINVNIITTINKLVRQINHETIYRNNNDQFINEIQIYYNTR